MDRLRPRQRQVFTGFTKAEVYSNGGNASFLAECDCLQNLSFFLFFSTSKHLFGIMNFQGFFFNLIIILLITLFFLAHEAYG